MIPAYNCSAQIERVLARLSQVDPAVFDQIWVIDNRSKDDTAESALRTSKELGLKTRVFRNSKNVNLGGTHKIAFREARKLGATHVLILHGDDQADAAEAPSLIALSQKHSFCSILGARFMKGSKLIGYDRARIVGNLVLNGIFSIFAGRPLRDLGSGLNLFALNDISDSHIKDFGNSLSFNYELILHLVKHRKNYLFSPISWREEDQISNARNFKIFFSAVRILIMWKLGIKQGRQSNEVGRVTMEEIS